MVECDDRILGGWKRQALPSAWVWSGGGTWPGKGFPQLCGLAPPESRAAAPPSPGHGGDEPESHLLQQRSWGLCGLPSRLAERVSCCLFADMINKQDCKYGDNCTFAYHQEEIDVWTEERKGTLNRDLLFDPLGGVKRGSLTIAKLLKEHQGIFTFLCEVPAVRTPTSCLLCCPTCLPPHSQWHGWHWGGAPWSALLSDVSPGTWPFGKPDLRISRCLDCQKGP